MAASSVIAHICDPANLNCTGDDMLQNGYFVNDMAPKVIGSGISRFSGLGIDRSPGRVQSKGMVLLGRPRNCLTRREGMEVLGGLVTMAMASGFFGLQTRLGWGGDGNLHLVLKDLEVR